MQLRPIKFLALSTALSLSSVIAGMAVGMHVRFVKSTTSIVSIGFDAENYEYVNSDEVIQ